MTHPIPELADAGLPPARTAAEVAGAVEALLFGSTLVNDTYVHADLTLKEFEQMRQAMPIDEIPGMESRLPGAG